MSDRSERVFEVVIRACADVVAARMLEVASLYEIREPPLITTKITREFDIDARVGRCIGENSYLIEIPCGCILILYTLFMRALSSPGFMPWIGSFSSSPGMRTETFGTDESWASREKRLDSMLHAIVGSAYQAPAGKSPLPLYEKDLDWQERFLDCLVADSERLPPTRKDAAHWLVNQALRLLVAHEVHHILAGHVDYVESSRLTSLSKTRPHGNIPPQQSRSMEADADDHAVWCLFCVLCFIHKGEIHEGPPGRRFLVEPWHALFVLHFCINAFLFLFDPPWLKVEQVTKSERVYPTPATRRARIVLRSRKLLEPLGLDWCSGPVEGGGVVHIDLAVEQQAYDSFVHIFGQINHWINIVSNIQSNLEAHARENIIIDETLADLNRILRARGHSYLRDELQTCT
jgi:hypothetical protein